MSPLVTSALGNVDTDFGLSMPFVFELGARRGQMGGQDAKFGPLGRPHNDTC